MEKDVGLIYMVESINNNEYFILVRPEALLSSAFVSTSPLPIPLYKFMNGRDNFSIRCLEDNVPVSDLIQREDHWMSPTLNKNTNLTITEQERDRLKYLQNREKRLLKRDEINAHKMELYRKQQEVLHSTIIVPYDVNPSFTEEQLHKQNLLSLKIIAKRFSIFSFPNRKAVLIRQILDRHTLNILISNSALIRRRSFSFRWFPTCWINSLSKPGGL
jgi:hypothetical protein